MDGNFFVMNNIASKKKVEILSYLQNGLIDSPDTCAARRKQQEGLIVFKKTMQMLTVRGMQDNENDKIYYNSFSRCRSRLDEYSRVSLTSVERK